MSSLKKTFCHLSKYIDTCMHTQSHTWTVWKPLIHSKLHHCVIEKSESGKDKWLKIHKRCYYLLINLFYLWVRAQLVANPQRKASRFSSNWNCFIWNTSWSHGFRGQGCGDKEGGGVSCSSSYLQMNKETAIKRVIKKGRISNKSLNMKSSF